MTDQDIILSVKELGYFTGRILVAAHCPPGAVPEISRVVVAQDLLVGNALEVLAGLVQANEYAFSDLTIEYTSLDAIRGSAAGVPGIGWAPWAVDKIIAQAHRRGAARVDLHLGHLPAFLEGVLSTRSVPGLAVLAVSRRFDASHLFAWNGILYKSTEPIEEMTELKDVFGFRAEAPISGDIALEVLEIRGMNSKPSFLTKFEPVRDQSKERAERLQSGRSLSPTAWSQIREVVSRTLVPASGRSRLGAG